MFARSVYSLITSPEIEFRTGDSGQTQVFVAVLPATVGVKNLEAMDGWTMINGLLLYSEIKRSNSSILALLFLLSPFPRISVVLTPCLCFGFKCLYSDTLTERAAASSGIKLGPDERDNQATAEVFYP